MGKTQTIEAEEPVAKIYPVRYLRVSMVNYKDADSHAETTTEYLDSDEKFQAFRKNLTLASAYSFMASATERQARNRLEQLNAIVENAKVEKAKLEAKLSK